MLEELLSFQNKVASKKYYFYELVIVLEVSIWMLLLSTILDKIIRLHHLLLSSYNLVQSKVKTGILNFSLLYCSGVFQQILQEILSSSVVLKMLSGHKPFLTLYIKIAMSCNLPLYKVDFTSNSKSHKCWSST